MTVPGNSTENHTVALYAGGSKGHHRICGRTLYHRYSGDRSAGTHHLALAAYPDLGCTGGPYEVATTYGVHKEVLCVGNEQSLRFAKDVLSEIIELFPSHYIHVGGDECPRDRWQQCPKCQALIHNNGWKDTKEHKAEDKLQSYFMTEVERFVNSKGRQIIGWDEILEATSPPMRPSCHGEVRKMVSKRLKCNMMSL